MRLTTKGRYAVMAMADLASFKDKGPISLNEISLRQNISLAYLEQIFIKLKNRNLVRSVRGAKGGYILETTPENIKISNIITAVDEEVKMLNCKKDSKKGCTNKSTKCITHNLWDQLDQHINNFFEKVKLQDLVKKNKF
tara:strand:- start:2364 stop:2780 length:417 start_codon:yes stop_codon:yes gene_type:complete